MMPTIKTCRICKEKNGHDHTQVECTIKRQQFEGSVIVQGRVPAPEWMDRFGAQYSRIRAWDESDQKWDKLLCVRQEFAFAHELRATIMSGPAAEREYLFRVLDKTIPSVLDARALYTTMTITSPVPMRAPKNRKAIMDVLLGG